MSNKQPVSYLQKDARWKDKPYRVKGEKSTVGSAGCGPSCAAMCIETLTGKTFTPLDACNWSFGHGYKALNQGTYYSYFTPQMKAFGIDCQMLNYENSYGKPNHANHKKVKELVNQGYYAIALMNKGLWTSGGHFILIWDWDDKVRIHDPNSTATNRLNGDPETFKSQAKYYWLVDARAYNRPVTAPAPPVTIPADIITNETEEETVKRYQTVQELPDWGQAAVQKLVDRKFLTGTGEGLNLSDDMIRMLVILDRAGAFEP